MKFRLCPKCGNDNAESAWACRKCGETLSVNSLIDLPTPEDALAAPSASEVPTADPVQALQMLRSNTPTRRHEACEELRVTESLSPQAIEALGQLTADPNKDVAEAARRALAVHLPSEKQCPYCAEDIKEAAIVCKHCGRDLDPEAVASVTQGLKRQPTTVPEPGTTLIRCTICDGYGEVRRTRQTFQGSKVNITTKCLTCGGRGLIVSTSSQSGTNHIQSTVESRPQPAGAPEDKADSLERKPLWHSALRFGAIFAGAHIVYEVVQYSRGWMGAAEFGGNLMFAVPVTFVAATIVGFIMVPLWRRIR